MTRFINSRLLYRAGFDKATVDALVAINADLTVAEVDVDTAQTTANTGVTNAATAQTSADNAGAYAIAVPGGIVWNADAATGTAPTGNPTADIVVTFYSKAEASVAVRTLRGTLTSAAGTVAVTAVSNSGLTTSYAVVNDGTSSVQAQVTVTFADSSKKTTTVAWNFLDPSVAGRTPASGGGK